MKFLTKLIIAFANNEGSIVFNGNRLKGAFI